ncbi:hypothetical protein TTHERM_00053730 (macronuclear) [Tetrahymena thermophila SB210]|uniref:Uncharacterized protein n=1 Tax=Tetrahymena thermophila (strain SB210) TaxID=312017 RepID=I7M6U1_TETTS|nr:hypothetical protein TTHERM_00053730 [Tetrahymena thermophila SB210]EAR87257.2 hypothetical protein TTHERM_00053730 [Tetrahymena thermophila SB210]|eukprot:XP_001007502.2 hypothetical protein TTHERM_00053730 [Tetrahymena thermophila SB210]
MIKQKLLSKLTYTEAGVIFRKELEQSQISITDRYEDEQAKQETILSKQKFIPQNSPDTTLNSPRIYLQTLRQEIVNTKDDQKLVGILLPDIQKSKVLQASQSQSSCNSPRISQYILKKVNNVKSVASEEDKLIKKLESLSLKLQNSQLKSQRGQLDKSNLNSPLMLSSSPKSVFERQSKFSYHYQENQNPRTNRKNFDLQNDMEDGNSLTASFKQQPINRNIFDQVEIDDQSKLFYLSSKLDKIYKKHSIIQVNQEAIKNNISSKYIKMSEIAAFDKNTFDLKKFKKDGGENLFAISKEFKEEEERKKQNIAQIHKHKYINFWKGQPLLGGSKNVDQRFSIPRQTSKKKLNLSPLEQAQIENMKMLFNSRS